MSENSVKIPLLLRIIFCMSVSFFVSCSGFSVVKSPFPLAFTAAFPPVMSAAAAAGSILSYISADDIHMIPYISGTAAVFISGLIIRKNDAVKRSAAAFTGCMVFFTGLCLSEGFSLINMLAFILAGLVSAAVCFYTISVLYSPKGAAAEMAVNRPAAAAVCFTAVSVCTPFSFLGIDPGEILAVFFILVYARNYRFSGGAAAGVIAAAALVLSGTADMNYAFYMGISGMAAGTFINYGRPAAASSFLLVFVICSALSGNSQIPVTLYLNMTAGLLIFCAVPVEKMHNEENRISSTFDEESGIMRIASFRMRLAADTIENAVPDIADEKMKKQNSTFSGSVKRIFENVCEECSGKNFCWGEKNARTFRTVLKACESGKEIPSSELPWCTDRERLSAEIKNDMSRMVADITADEYMSMSRSLLAEQFSASSDIIRALSSDVQEKYTIDRRITDRMKKILEENDIGFTSLVAYYNENRRLFIEVYCSRNACISGYRIYKTLSEEFGKNFECTKCYDGEEMRFLICERPAYNIESDISQNSSGYSEKNGDTCDCFRDSYGKVYLVISDGMGTGENAAGYSAKTVSLFRKFTLGGLSVEQSIKMINSVMRSESDDDCFATLDISVFDLDSGNMTVYKSGAAPTIFCHSGNVFSVCSPTFPVGIADRAGVYKKTFSLKTGDIIAMISDGVPEQTYGIIRRELTEKDDVSRISENICRLAKKISCDDVSVITAKLIRQ